MEITDVAIDELLHIIDYPWFSYLFMELKNKKKNFYMRMDMREDRILSICIGICNGRN